MSALGSDRRIQVRSLSGTDRLQTPFALLALEFVLGLPTPEEQPSILLYDALVSLCRLV